MTFRNRILKTDHVFHAAEIANEADALIAELRDAITALMAGSTAMEDGSWGRVCVPSDSTMDIGRAALAKSKP